MTSGSSLSLRGASSPTKLRAASLATAGLAILLSVVGFTSVGSRHSSIDAAAASAAQLIRVQDVRVLVVEADSLASRAYLVGGQEDPAQRVAYDQSLEAAASGLVDAAAAASGGDADLLQAANAKLGTYIGLVEQARANNRQGFPVGAAYQRQARTINESIVADLRSVEADARTSVDSNLADAHRSSWSIVLVTIMLVAAIGAGGWWLALRWRRLVNVPLAVAGLLVLLTLTIGVGLNASAMNDADATVEGSLTTADTLAQARAAGFDARSNEALTLIYRGSGQAYASAWQVSSSIVGAAFDRACGERSLGCNASSVFANYSDGYAVVRALDDGGNWDAAVELSTTGRTTAAEGIDAPDPVAAFEVFSSASASAISGEAGATATGFAAAVDGLSTLRWVIAAVGLFVAGLALAGYGQRSKEYR